MNVTGDTHGFVSEADLHAYVDGHLDEDGRARVEAWLNHHPDRAEEIRGWQRDAQRLRAALGTLPDSTSRSNLDPALIRALHRQRVRSQFALAAMLVLTFAVGGIGGWQVRRWAASTEPAPMADALQAYRMFAMERRAQLDVTQHQAGDVQTWLDENFQNAARLPDLDNAGFHPVGGRLLATDNGPAAMVMYEDRQGSAITFYIRPPSPHAGTLPRGQRLEGQLAATYWSADGYNYALVSRANAREVRAIRDASRPSAT
ncbi:MAG: anti-sigma factor [Proteobacteria bacterium]|uniref:anti-sigma factor family protein n=1 Tax=Rudaea sp. TaxID=2136325 RepID=UPI00321FB93F|nr:anti-sigma factor [Pseudomonadota bacterium]